MERRSGYRQCDINMDADAMKLRAGFSLNRTDNYDKFAWHFTILSHSLSYVERNFHRYTAWHDRLAHADTRMAPHADVVKYS